MREPNFSGLSLYFQPIHYLLVEHKFWISKNKCSKQYKTNWMADRTAEKDKKSAKNTLVFYLFITL